MFLDESGEACIKTSDPRFNVFVLCGVIFKEDSYDLFNSQFDKLKIKYFGSADVVFHSIKMRKPEGIFRKLKGDILDNWYIDIGKILSEADYKIISCVIDKDKYRTKYPHKNLAYEESLTFVCERAIRLIGKRQHEGILHFCLEKRNPDKDTQLRKTYSKFVRFGTDFVNTSDFKVCNPTLHFRSKSKNTNGLQLADLCAYPIARKFLTPDKEQKTYSIIEKKFYRSWYGKAEGCGLKYYP